MGRRDARAPPRASRTRSVADRAARSARDTCRRAPQTRPLARGRAPRARAPAGMRARRSGREDLRARRRLVEARELLRVAVDVHLAVDDADDAFRGDVASARGACPRARAAREPTR